MGFGTDNLGCRAHIALHNYQCIHKTMDCSDLFANPKKNDVLVFYCTEADFKAKNNNFCETGYCSTGLDPCDDHDLYHRINAVSKKYKECLYRKDREKSCSKSMNNSKEKYTNCRLSVEIYIFVFLFSQVILER